MSGAAAPAEAGVSARPSPYQGLVPYTEADAEWFFGRDEWSEVVSDNFRAYRITVLYGASGVGKSSLLRAGVMRRLVDQAGENVASLGAARLLPVGFSAWSLDDPMTALKDAVRHAGAQVGLNAPPASAPEGTLVDVLEAWPVRAEAQVLVVLDQLEELFAYHDRPDDPVLEELTASLRRRDPAVHFLLSIREDALASLDRFEGYVSGLGEHLLRLEHLDSSAAREAIVRPLELWNRVAAGPGEQVEIEPALIDAVIDQVTAGKVVVGGNGAVPSDEAAGVEAPYLQLVLIRLWDEERRNGSRLLRLQTLERLGGADRIVRTHLDTALAALPERDQDLAGRTFRYLVTPSGTKIAHRIADLAEYAQAPPQQVEHVVGRLAGEARVLRPAGDGRYEIYHDALAGPIVDWRGRWEERQRRRRERRRFAILGGIAAGLGAVAVAIAVLAVLALQARQDARKGQSQALAQQAIATLDADAPRALRLAVQAADAAHASEAEDALRVALANYALERTLRGHRGAARSGSFSPDGKLVIAGGDDGTARIWNAATGRVVGVLRGPAFPVTSAAFSPDGALAVTAGYDGTVRLWDAARRRIRRTLRGDGSPLDVAAFDAGGDRLVTGGHFSLARVWDVASGRPLRTLGDEGVFSAAFSPDGKRIVTATGYDAKAKVWDARSGRLLLTLSGARGGAGNLEHVAYSTDGNRIVAAGSDGTARIWDASRGRLLQSLTGHEGAVFDAAFSPDGESVITAGSDGTTRIWDADTGRVMRVIGSGGTLFAAAFSPDDKRILTAGDDGTARIWKIEGDVVDPLHTRSAERAVWTAAFSSDGTRVVTAGDNGRTLLWDAARARPLHTLLPRGRRVRAAAFSRDNRLVAAAGDDGKARVWDVDSGDLVHALDNGSPLRAAAFNADGTRLATGDVDHRVRIWNVGNGRLLRTLTTPDYEGAVLAAAFSPDGSRLLSAGGGGVARIWATKTGRPLHTLDTHAEIRSAAFSPDGRLAAVASDVDAAWLWNVSSGRPFHTLTGHAGVVWTADFSRDGRLLVTASDDELGRIWDVASGRRLHTLGGHRGTIRSAIFSPDGKLVVTASFDGSARLWDTATGRPLATLAGDGSPIYRAAFTPDGTRIVTAGEHGIAVWPCELCGLSVSELRARAQDRLAASS